MLIPNADISRHTARPVMPFILSAFRPSVPWKDTSMVICRVSIDTSASATPIFRMVIRIGDYIFLTLTMLITKLGIVVKTVRNL